MSQSDRKAIRIIMYLYALNESGHFSYLSHDIKSLLNDLITSYTNGGVILDNNLKMDFLRYFRTVEDKIEKLNLSSSLVMMLSLNLAFAEYFLQYVKSVKKNSWMQLFNFSQKHLSKNYSKYEKEFDKALKVVEVMI